MGFLSLFVLAPLAGLLAFCLAAWLAQTGDFAAAEEVVRDIRERYDGEKRSPFDEAECGHHYARALAAWSVYKAFAANHLLQ